MRCDPVWRKCCSPRCVAHPVWRKCCSPRCVAHPVWRKCCSPRGVAHPVWRKCCSPRCVVIPSDVNVVPRDALRIPSDVNVVPRDALRIPSDVNVVPRNSVNTSLPAAFRHVVWRDEKDCHVHRGLYSASYWIIRSGSKSWRLCVVEYKRGLVVTGFYVSSNCISAMAA